MAKKVRNAKEMNERCLEAGKGVYSLERSPDAPKNAQALAAKYGITEHIGTDEQTIFQERIDQPTPNGGAYSIAYFQDAAGDRTSKDSAVKMEIVEFSAEGEPVFRTYLEKSGS